jgi:hypothetical protein
VSPINTLALSLLLSTALQVEKRENPFLVAGVDDLKAVEQFLAALQQAVAADDARAVAKLARVPLEVSIGGKRERVTSRARFVLVYPRVFTPCLKRVVAAAKMEALFASWRGIMFGSGAVWFGPQESGELRIITINGPIEGEELCKER